MDFFSIIVVAVCFAVGGWLLWRARRRGCARSRRLRQHREESQKLLQEQKERWHDAFEDWQRQRHTKEKHKRTRYPRHANR